MGKFSPNEIVKRKARLMAVRHLGPIARSKKAADRKRKKREQKNFVGDCAALGVFVPVADFE